MTKQYDAVVVGAGPNGLAAAITLALKGLKVFLVEEKEKIGGGVKSKELTLPGFTHDLCSTVYPFAFGSPFFRSLPLSSWGLEWIQPPLPLAHPLERGECVYLARSPEETAACLEEDEEAYLGLFRSLLKAWPRVDSFLLGPPSLPRHPFALFRFACKALRSAEGLAAGTFQQEKAQALFAGLAAHSMLPLDRPMSAAFGLVLGVLGHLYGWPIAKGGAQSLAEALGAYFHSLGGEIQTGWKISSLKELPPAKAVLFDLTPGQVVQLAKEEPEAFPSRRLRSYRYGPGVFKMDWALEKPIPWIAEPCLQAATVHVGGTLQEISRAEKQVWQGRVSDKPYLIVVQPSLFDALRAPDGRQTAWAYCHVPNGSTLDVTEAIEGQIERFAPGFKKNILAKSSKNTAALQRCNANYVGGDIAGGSQEARQLISRALKWPNPYAICNSRFYLCSSSTPPGAGVHGMCGFHAARACLTKVFGISCKKIP